MAMEIEVLVRGELRDATEALREYAHRRLSFAAGRFAHRIRRVTVRLVDENGPRRGVDTRCSITADLVDGGPIFVEAASAWPFAAITLAAGRLSEALRRDAGRHAPRRGASAGGPRSGGDDLYAS